MDIREKVKEYSDLQNHYDTIGIRLDIAFDELLSEMTRLAINKFSDVLQSICYIHVPYIEDRADLFMVLFFKQDQHSQEILKLNYEVEPSIYLDVDELKPSGLNFFQALSKIYDFAAENKDRFSGENEAYVHDSHGKKTYSLEKYDNFHDFYSWLANQ